VLVVDPDELVRWSVAEGLRENGFEVRLATDEGRAVQGPEAALALLAHDRPRLDGLVAAERVRRRHPRCAVVLMTPDPTPELHREARERGISGVLPKPFSLDRLLAAVHSALEPEGAETASPEEGRKTEAAPGV
jgi:DNA-binding NtrC family response regulator